METFLVIPLVEETSTGERTEKSLKRDKDDWDGEGVECEVSKVLW